jgi:cell fate (sporulation/competence/biofilm development) regulator YlbF (YheA/YmcA/DUF963 family)
MEIDLGQYHIVKKTNSGEQQITEEVHINFFLKEDDDLTAIIKEIRSQVLNSLDPAEDSIKPTN